MTSPRTTARLTRILAMLPWVIAHPGCTVSEVCDRFGYSRRRLMEDLDLVFVCGLPGYGPGDLMVAYVEGDEVVVDTADYFAQAPRLTAAEGLALLAAGMALLGSGQAPPELGSAVEKLGHALLPEGGEVLSVDLAAEPEMVGRLRTAALAGSVMRMTYVSLSRNETTVRRVEPRAVFSSLGNWYLSAFCRTAGAERLFRVDRIRELEETEERFEVPEGLPPPEVRYTPSDDDVHCIIELGPAARWVAEYYPVEVLADEAGTLTIGFSAYDAMVAAGLLLRLGPAARLIQGDEVARALAEVRTRILARYGETL